MKRLHGILCVAAVAIGLAYAAVHWPVVFFAASVAMAYAAARRYWPPVEILAGAVVALAVVLGGVLLSSERRERLRELVDCEQDVPTVLDGRSDE